MSEGKIWRTIRDKLSRGTRRLWRNEVGHGLVVRHRNPKIRQKIIDRCKSVAEGFGGSAERIAYGLCVGSGDLVGWEEVTITPEMVGRRVLVFLSVETKTATGGVREEQTTWLNAVNDRGGRAIIARSLEDAQNQLDNPFTGADAGGPTDGETT